MYSKVNVLKKITRHHEKIALQMNFFHDISKQFSSFCKHIPDNNGALKFFLFRTQRGELLLSKVVDLQCRPGVTVSNLVGTVNFSPKMHVQTINL